MARKLFFLSALMLIVFAPAAFADSIQSTHYRIRFDMSIPFALEANARYAIPAGEYMLREVEKFPDHLFSLERASDRKHLAFLTTVRIDRARFNWRHKDRAVFDFEDRELPVLEEFYVSGADGWEILSVVYNKKAGLIDVANLKKVNYTVTSEPMVVETVPPPEPLPPSKAEPEIEPIVEKPLEEAKPVEPVAPIPERKRVRKE
jgi:hypothetical protein